MDDSIGNTNQTVGVGPKGHTGATVYDKVEVTPSGHRFRVNDEPGAEEISRTHTTGTFERFDPSGGRELVVVGDNYTAYLSGSNLLVRGVCNITVEGDCNLNVGVKTDPETGEESGGNFKVEAENIYLNSRKATNISAGTYLNIETRSPEAGGTGGDGAALGGDIGITSAGGYNLKVEGEATERFEKSLDTDIVKAHDLNIGGDYEIAVTGGAENESGGTYNGDMIFDVKGLAEIVSKKRLRLMSKAKTIIAGRAGVIIRSPQEINLKSHQDTTIESVEANIDIDAAQNIDIDATQNIDVRSVQDTIFNSQAWLIKSGPVTITPTIDADATITAQGQIESLDDVLALAVSLKTHRHGQPSTGQDATTQGNTLGPI